MSKFATGRFAQILLGLAAFNLIILFGRWVPPAEVPNGAILQAAVVGMLTGLLAMGLVLIYRTNRIINFAQGALGASAAAVTKLLVQSFRWNYFLALPVGLLIAVLVAAGVSLLIRRFAKAPRLILTVATIGIAQVLTFLELIPAVIQSKRNGLELKPFTSPLSFKFQFQKVIFTGDYALVLIAVPLVVAGLAFFFRFTGYGLAARATAENSDRARLLGVRVKRVSLLVWVIAGGMSAVAAILQAPITGVQLGTVAGVGLLLRALAAAVIGRMESLPITFVAAIGLAIVEKQFALGWGNSRYTDVFLFAVILVALLVQRRRVGRADEGGSSWQAVEEVRPIPVELKRLPEVRGFQWALGALGVAAAIVMPLTMGPSRLNLVGVIFIYAIVGLSMVVLTGWAGQVSLGHWAIMGVGAFVAARLATLATPVDFFFILVIAGTCGAAVAVAIGFPALRIRGLFFGVTTLAFAVAAQSYFLRLSFLQSPPHVVRPWLFGRIDVSSERTFYWVCLAGLVVAFLAARNLRRSRIGRILIATRDNEKAAQAMAVGVNRAKLIAFGVSGFLAAFAGALYTYSQGKISTNPFPPETSLLIFSMVVIGGMGSLSGALLGAGFLQGTQYFLSKYAFLQFLITGVGTLVLLLVVPGGLGQIFYKVRDAYLRRVAARRSILVPSLVADRREEAAAMPIPPISVAAAGGGG